MGILGKVLFALASLTTVVGAVDPPVVANVTQMTFSFEGTELMGSYAAPFNSGPHPAVVIIPEYTMGGVTGEYEEVRATMIAQEWGFMGFTVDIFGEDQSMLSAETLTGRMDAALEAVLAMDSVDSSKVAVFGYSTPTVLMYAVNGLGTDTVKALVSFHGDISSNWLPEELKNVGPKLLVLSGEKDDTSSEIMDLEITLDAANATWEITRYSGAGPSFTVFEKDGYDEFADMRSWESAHEFVSEAFGLTQYQSAQPDSFVDSVMAVDYSDTDGTQLKGWLAMPDSEIWGSPAPAVVILPDWDGVNDYEKERAVALAELGYVAFAADIYGADKQDLPNIPDRIAEVTFYSTNPDVYFSRIQSAIDQVKMMDSDVFPEEIALIGYCFGGTGVILYSLRGGQDVKAAVAFHGSFNGFNVLTDQVTPALLVLSGGDDGLHGNQTIMETAFDGGSADWEITRYAGVNHGYTSFTSGAYDLVADARSWDSMLKFFLEELSVPDISNSPTMAPTTLEEPTGGVPDISNSPTMAPATLEEPAGEDAASGVVGMMTALVACISALFFF